MQRARLWNQHSPAVGTKATASSEPEPTTPSALKVNGCFPRSPTFCYDRAFLGFNRLEGAALG